MSCHQMHAIQSCRVKLQQQNNIIIIIIIVQINIINAVIVIIMVIFLINVIATAVNGSSIVSVLFGREQLCNRTPAAPAHC